MNPNSTDTNLNLIVDPLLGAIQPPPMPSHLLFENETFDEEIFPNQFIDNIEEEEVEFEHVLKDTLRYVAGFRRGRKSGKFSDEAQQLMGDANLSFANKNYDEAVDKIKQCIQLSPNTQQPWYLLGLIYQELGNQLKAMQTYFIAAHFDMKNTQLWLRLANLSKQQNQIKEAIYCTTKAIQSAPSTDLYFMRSSFFLQVDMPFKCAKDYLEIVKLNKHSISLMMEAVNVFLSKGRFDLISQILLQVFDGFRLLITENVPIQNVPLDRPFQSLNFVHVDLLFESLLCQKLYKEALVSTKSAILVLYHSLLDDVATDHPLLLQPIQDVDLEDLEFNALVSSLAPRLNNPNLSANGLPLTWRTYLGICRCFMDQLDVAKSHFHFLFSDFKPDAELLYDQIFTILLECKYYQTCVDYITTILPNIHSNFKWSLFYFCAQAHANLEEYELALQYYTDIINNEGDFCNESRIQIAQLQTKLDLNPLDSWRDVKTQIPANLSINLNQITLDNTKLDLKELQNYMDIIKSKCSVLQQALNEALEAAQNENNDIIVKSLAVECSEAYGSWFELFLKTKAFFCKDKNKKFIGIQNNKLHYVTVDYDPIELKVDNTNINDDDLSHVFLNCTFNEWFTMILNLIKSFILSDNFMEAVNVIKQSISSNLFINVNRKCQMYLIMASLYKKLDLLDLAMESTRQLMVICPFRLNGYHLFMQLIGHDYKGLQVLSNSNNARSMKRHLNKFNKTLTKDTDSTETLYTLLINAYCAMNSKSIQSALTYLMRAVLIAPEMEITNLLAGIGWITRGMNRSTEDRHLNIITGISYLIKYYKIEKQRYFKQACYNIGRGMHHIGLYDYAVTYYVNCICSEENGTIGKILKQRSWIEIDKLAAYNLSLILRKQSNSVALGNKILMHVNKV